MNHFSEGYFGLGKRFIEHLSVISSDITSVKTEVLWQDIATPYNEMPSVYRTLNHL